MEGGRHVAVAPVGTANGVDPIELAVVLPALQGKQHLVHEVVDVEKLELHSRVVHLDGQSVGDVVAECGHGRVVVRATPLAEQVREAVHQHAGAGLGGVAEEQLLAGLLALAVGMAGVTTINVACIELLSITGHRLPWRLRVSRSVEAKPKLPLREVLGVLRAVDAGQVEHEVGLRAPAVELLSRRVEVVLENILYLYGETAQFAVADVPKTRAQVAPHEALRARYKYLHPSVLLGLLNEVALAGEFLLDVFQRGDLLLRFLHVQLPGVVGVELRQGVARLVALLEVLVVVQTAVVGRNAVEVPQIFGLGALLVGEQRLVHLLAMADADHADVVAVAPEELANGLGLRADGARRRLLNQDVAVTAVLEGEQNQVDGLVEAHDEARHRRLRHRYGVARPYLLDPQRNNRPARAHHVAVARAADLRLARIAALGNGDLLLDGLGDAHGVDGIGGLVGRQTDYRLDSGLYCGRKHIVGAYHVGFNRLHGEELARRNLLQRRGMEDIVDARHGVAARLQQAPHVADKELDLVGNLPDNEPDTRGACRPASSRPARKCGSRLYPCSETAAARHYRKIPCLR